jgi:hypothetical protein
MPPAGARCRGCLPDASPHARAAVSTSSCERDVVFVDPSEPVQLENVRAPRGAVLCCAALHVRTRMTVQLNVMTIHQGRLALQTHKDLYAPGEAAPRAAGRDGARHAGDTVRLLVSSPMPECWGVLVLQVARHARRRAGALTRRSTHIARISNACPSTSPASARRWPLRHASNGEGSSLARAQVEFVVSDTDTCDVHATVIVSGIGDLRAQLSPVARR